MAVNRPSSFFIRARLRLSSTAYLSPRFGGTARRALLRKRRRRAQPVHLCGRERAKRRTFVSIELLVYAPAPTSPQTCGHATAAQSGARQILLVLPSEALRTHSADLKTNSASPAALLEPRETTINTWRAGTDCVTDHDQEAAMIASALFRTSSVANTPKRTSVPTANCCGPYLWSEHEETHR